MQFVVAQKEHIRGDGKSGLLAKLHGDDTLVPTCIQVLACGMISFNEKRTLDDLANANLDIEVTTADGAIKSLKGKLQS
jgi:hypothetical protein